MVTGSLLDIAKYLGSLKFKVWERMKDVITYSKYIQDHIQYTVAPVV